MSRISKGCLKCLDNQFFFFPFSFFRRTGEHLKVTMRSKTPESPWFRVLSRSTSFTVNFPKRVIRIPHPDSRVPFMISRRESIRKDEFFLERPSRFWTAPVRWALVTVMERPLTVRVKRLEYRLGCFFVMIDILRNQKSSECQVPERISSEF